LGLLHSEHSPRPECDVVPSCAPGTALILVAPAAYLAYTISWTGRIIAPPAGTRHWPRWPCSLHAALCIYLAPLRYDVAVDTAADGRPGPLIRSIHNSIAGSRRPSKTRLSNQGLTDSSTFDAGQYHCRTCDFRARPSSRKSPIMSVAIDTSTFSTSPSASAKAVRDQDAARAVTQES